MYFKLPLILAIILLIAACDKTSVKPTFDPELAWAEFENTLEQHYAYLNDPQFDRAGLTRRFKKLAVGSKTEEEFINWAQTYTRYFADPHLNVGPYDDKDYSVFPTGSDISAHFVEQTATIRDVKIAASADKLGVQTNMQITHIDGQPYQRVIEALFQTKMQNLNKQQREFGLNIVLSGIRNKPRKLTVKTAKGEERQFSLAPTYDEYFAVDQGPTVSKQMIGNIGYIKINNALGKSQTVADFKQTLTSLLGTQGLIIDLRNTASGGNTGVAEPIMGHFVTQKTAYQKYQVQTPNVKFADAKMQTAYVTPNTPLYNKPVVVLAGRWTGSMGEGMTIGLDAIGVKAVVGAPMADLLGGIKTLRMKHSSLWIELGFERLYHVDGRYREDYVPNSTLLAADRNAKGEDPALLKALALLNQG